MLEHSSLVFVKRVKGKGRGVFAKRPIARDTIIEKVPVILIPIQNIKDGWKNTSLSRFFFVRNKSAVCLALGYGSLYNHSYQPNAIYEDANPGMMIYRAIRDIPKGEEITINYNGDPKDKRDVGFRVV